MGRKGLGLADAERFASAGYAALVADLDVEAAASAAERLGGGAIGMCVDVADPAAVDASSRASPTSSTGSTSLSKQRGHQPSRADRRADRGGWQRMIDIHLGGTFRCSKAGYPLLAWQGCAIVNISSIAAILGAGRRASYSAAKGGIAALTRDLAMEWALDGIRVNAVAPGVIETEILVENIERGLLDPTTFDARIPLGRMGRPAEVAEAVFFLADTAT